MTTTTTTFAPVAIEGWLYKKGSEVSFHRLPPHLSPSLAHQVAVAEQSIPVKMVLCRPLRADAVVFAHEAGLGGRDASTSRRRGLACSAPRSEVNTLWPALGGAPSPGCRAGARLHAPWAQSRGVASHDRCRLVRVCFCCVCFGLAGWKK